MTHKYWEPQHFDKVEKATSYKDLFKIAEEILRSMPPQIGQVCGPISTGGAGSVEKNIERLKQNIFSLQEKGFVIFDQMPFEIPMQRIIKERASLEYDHSLLTDFYLPIFESGLVKKYIFFLIGNHQLEQNGNTNRPCDWAWK